MKVSNNDFPSVLLSEQASAPATPATGLHRVYFKTDGLLYEKDDAGVETEVGAGGGGGGGDALVANPLSQFAATTSAQLAGVVSDETGTGVLVFSASPAFTGTPTAPTATAGTNTTQLSTTAFVQTAIANLVASSPGALDTLNELAAALGNDANFASTVTDSLAGKQPLDATLTEFAALTIAANSVTLGTGTDTFSQITLGANTFLARSSSGNAAAKTITDFGLSLVDDADAAAGRTTLGLVIGTDVQAFDADLSAIAALTGTNNIYYRSAANTWTSVTIGSGLTFSSGTLSASGGGGGLSDGDYGDVVVSSSGTALTVESVTGALALKGIVSPSQITANQNNYDPTGLSAASILRLTSNAARSITGLAGGVDGRLLSLANVGTNTINLAIESSSSTAANRFSISLPSGYSGSIPIYPNSELLLRYDSTTARWRLLAQGAAHLMADCIARGFLICAESYGITLTGKDNTALFNLSANQEEMSNNQTWYLPKDNPTAAGQVLTAITLPGSDKVNLGWSTPAASAQYVATITSGQTATIDWSQYDSAVITLDGDMASYTIAFSNVTAGKRVTLILKTTDTMPNVTWPGSVVWASGYPANPSGSSAEWSEFYAVSASVVVGKDQGYLSGV